MFWSPKRSSSLERRRRSVRDRGVASLPRTLGSDDFAATSPAWPKDQGPTVPGGPKCKTGNASSESCGPTFIQLLGSIVDVCGVLSVLGVGPSDQE